MMVPDGGRMVMGVGGMPDEEDLSPWRCRHNGSSQPIRQRSHKASGDRE
jgi:hypothetical protein